MLVDPPGFYPQPAIDGFIISTSVFQASVGEVKETIMSFGNFWCGKEKGTRAGLLRSYKGLKQAYTLQHNRKKCKFITFL